MSRVYNFSAGPATLPEVVLAEARDQLLDYSASGMSILESSHRGKEFKAIHAEAISNLRELLGVGDEHEILLLQGGATLQFAMVPLNLLAPGQVADYALSGAWAAKAFKEASAVGAVRAAADCAADRPARMPRVAELDLTPGAAYLHITTNETISGAQWNELPTPDAPLIADMSSDILSRPIDANALDLIFAGAQKNLGPSGVTLVVIRRSLLDRVPESVPPMLRYRTHAEAGSMYNTPPCFGIYLLMLVTRWLKGLGGVEGIAERNRAKAAKLYSAIDATDFYSGTAAVDCRSEMNVTFRLPSEELEAKFVAEAAAAGMKGLKGHRSVGGIRASIYNACPPEAVEALVSFMTDFERLSG